MNSTPRIRNTTGAITIVSGIMALACLLLSAMGANYNFDVFSNPVLILTIQGVSVPLIRWSMITDLFGYYLLLLPAIFHLNDWMKPKTPWCNLLTFCGTSYVLLGAIGASILAVVWPSLHSAFQTAMPVQQEHLKLSFQMISDLVYGGMWNLLEVLLGGVWWLGVGTILRGEQKVLGYVTILLGFFTVLDGVGAVVEMKALSEVGLNVYLILAPVWAIWFGAALMKK